MNNFVNCNLEVYSKLVVKFGSTTMFPYKYDVKIQSRLTISVSYDNVNKVVKVVAGKNVFEVSIRQYDHLILNLSAKGNRQFVTRLNKGTGWNIICYYPRIKTVTRDNYQQDPTITEKSKYRNRSKSFSSKRSDLPRGKYTRDAHLKTLVDTRVDAKVSRSYNFKHISLRFLAWKLNTTINSLLKQFKIFRMVDGNTTTSLDLWLNSSLIHILVLVGFATNYVTANQLIQKGVVYVNGLLVDDEKYLIRSGDVIMLSNSTLKQLINYSFNNQLEINYTKGVIYVKNTSNLIDVLLYQSNYIVEGNFSSDLLNPMINWTWNISEFLKRGFI